ncbi:MAG TPA: DUF433 domain-containing protein [Pirellulales bacterium]|jgi:uncharacterized protein (DUF433 family)|nr:DUF433 domain-containing protein [Pirellulales bacterium]
MHAAIIDRGRGPEIAGTRITVYDIMDYYQQGWHHTGIAARLRISSRQVIAAIEYIEANRDEVHAVYQEILERNARGNPPEIRARLEASRAKLRAWAAQRPAKTGSKSDREPARNGREKFQALWASRPKKANLEAADARNPGRS